MSLAQVAVDASKPTEWFLTQGALGIFVLILLFAVGWLMLKREKDRSDFETRLAKERESCDAEKARLHEAHKQEMREDGKVKVVLLEKTHQAIDRLFDLEERNRRP